MKLSPEAEAEIERLLGDYSAARNWQATLRAAMVWVVEYTIRETWVEAHYAERYRAAILEEDKE